MGFQGVEERVPAGAGWVMLGLKVCAVLLCRWRRLLDSPVEIESRETMRVGHNVPGKIVADAQVANPGGCLSQGGAASRQITTGWSPAAVCRAEPGSPQRLRPRLAFRGCLSGRIGKSLPEQLRTLDGVVAHSCAGYSPASPQCQFC